MTNTIPEGFTDINAKRPPYGNIVACILDDGSMRMAALGDYGWYFGKWGRKVVALTQTPEGLSYQPVVAWCADNDEAIMREANARNFSWTEFLSGLNQA